MKKIKYNYSNPFIKWIVFPAIITAFSFTFFIVNILFSDFSATVLSYNHGLQTQSPYRSLGSGDVLMGSFYAKENNLGIVAFRFKSETPISGILKFQLSDETGKLIVSSSYDARGFYYLSEYPFGFPVINDSIGKRYDFSISFYADNQALQNAVQIKDSDLISKYKFEITQLKAETGELIKFILKKIEYSLYFENQLKLFFLYSTPLLSYFIFSFIYSLSPEIFKKILFLFGKTELYTFFLENKKYITNGYLRILALFYLYSVISPFSYWAIDIFMMIVWFFYVHKKKMSSKFTFVHIAIFSFPLIFFIIFDFLAIIEKMLATIFLLLVIAFVHSTIELIYASKSEKK